VVEERAALRYLRQESRLQIEPQAVQLLYEPAILGVATVRFVDRKRQFDEAVEKMLLVPAHEGASGVDWDEAESLSTPARDLRKQPETTQTEQGPFFANAPDQANRGNKLDKLASDLADWLYYNTKLTLQKHDGLKLFQAPGERERDFRIRLQQAAREQRDQEVDKLKRQFALHLDRLRAKLRKEEQELAEDQAEHAARKQQEVIGIGETVLSWVFGRRSMRGLSTAASKRRMTARAGQEVSESEQEIAELQQEIAELEQQLKEQSEEITLKWANLLDEVSREEVMARRSDVDVRMVALAWLPSWHFVYGEETSLRTATIAAYQLPAVG
jgi:hypothetical protein